MIPSDTPFGLMLTAGQISTLQQFLMDRSDMFTNRQSFSTIMAALNDALDRQIPHGDGRFTLTVDETQLNLFAHLVSLARTSERLSPSVRQDIEMLRMSVLAVAKTGGEPQEAHDPPWAVVYYFGNCAVSVDLADSEDAAMETAIRSLDPSCFDEDDEDEIGTPIAEVLRAAQAEEPTLTPASALFIINVLWKSACRPGFAVQIVPTDTLDRHAGS